MTFEGSNLKHFVLPHKFKIRKKIIRQYKNTNFKVYCVFGSNFGKLVTNNLEPD